MGSLNLQAKLITLETTSRILLIVPPCPALASPPSSPALSSATAQEAGIHELSTFTSKPETPVTTPANKLYHLFEPGPAFLFFFCDLASSCSSFGSFRSDID
jgi:hypothetical protein